MSFQENDIIDFFEDRRISCGLILECDDRKVRVLQDQGKETKISPKRVLTVMRDPGFPIGGSRDEQVGRLRQIAEERETIKKGVDLGELWEVLGTDASEMELGDLSELVFGNDLGLHSAAGLLRAISEDRIYFRIKPDAIEVSPPDRVEQALQQKEKERQRVEFVSRATEFLRCLKDKEPIAAQDAPEGLIPMLEEAALYESDWTVFKTLKQAFSNAGVLPELDPFRALVKLGIWNEDENVRLRAEKVPIGFDAEDEQLAVAASEKPLPSSVRDLVGEHTIAIDSVRTRDVDDALSVSLEGDDVIVRIHITDVAHFVEHDSPLDNVLRDRATSIYLPDMLIPMIPPVLSENAASLTVGKQSPAMTLTVRIGSDLKVKEYEICTSVISLTERITYEEADERIADSASREALLFRTASAMRESRVAAGALIFRDPELTVRVGEDGEVEVAVRDRETPSQVLVSEMMILANALFARFLADRRVPALFRSQPPPNEKIELGEAFDPVQSYRARKALARSDLTLEPAPHSTLGLDCYTTATSPLRRYSDLLVQRQLKSVVQWGRPLMDRDEVERVLTEISHPLARSGPLERERQRYFLFKYLQQRKHEEFEAVVLQRFPRFHLVHVLQFGFNAPLNSREGLALNPHDRVLVRIDKVKPREDKIGLSLVKLL